jgi:phage/plasmid-like protein (TIGR03299 family)
MSHLIDMSNGRANMAYAASGGTPWHYLGGAMTEGATIDEWRTAAGMGYKVLSAPVQFTNGAIHTYSDKIVLYRSDTNTPLGVVSKAYKVVQPAEVLEFFRDLCDAQDMQMETAGVLKGGAVYWALARYSDSLTIGKGDRTNRYALLSSTADGSGATQGQETAIRVVCNNTIRIALASADGAVRTRHNTVFDANATKRTMGLRTADASWAEFKAKMEALAEKPVSAQEAQDFFSDLLRPAGERAKPRADMGAQNLSDLLAAPVGTSATKLVTDKAPVERAIRGLEDLLQSYYRAPGAVPGTAYGLVQGVTHYIDHVRGTSDDKRLTSAWFGQGNTLKTKAFDAALELTA